MKQPDPLMVEKMEKILALAKDSEEVMSVPMACGYIQGMAMTPEFISPMDWIPEIYGGALPEFEDEETALDTFRYLGDTFNRYADQLHKKQLGFPYPLHEINAEDFEDILDWIFGFYTAVSGYYDVWLMEEDPFVHEEGSREVDLSLFYIEAIADPGKFKEKFAEDTDFDPEDPKVRAKLISILPDMIGILAEYARKKDQQRLADFKQSRPQGQGPMKKVGRNVACPCGSGKKYKKCCGLSPTLWN